MDHSWMNQKMQKQSNVRTKKKVQEILSMLRYRIFPIEILGKKKKKMQCLG